MAQYDPDQAVRDHALGEAVIIPYDGPITTSPNAPPKASRPDVPEDIDDMLEHLNDPNYDLRRSFFSSSVASVDFELGLRDARGGLHARPGAVAAFDPNAASGSGGASASGAQWGAGSSKPEGKWTGSDSEYESDRYSTDRAESRNSTDIEFDDESPYPEVRASVASTDIPTMPVNTFRMWFLGLLATIVVAGLNQLYEMRYPNLYITGIVVQLLTLPLGKALQYILPTYIFVIPYPWIGLTWGASREDGVDGTDEKAPGVDDYPAGKKFGVKKYLSVPRLACGVSNWRFTLNPGPFTIKEHVCITVMANIVSSGVYANDVIASQKFFYEQEVSYAYQYCIALGTQLVGFSIGGLLRPLVVWPTSMIWPGALVNSALFNTLHKNYGQREGRHMSRERFFLYIFVGSFLWYWVPGFFFTGLSVFNWVCWIAPQNQAVNALFGTQSGLGMSFWSFDWSMIAYVGSPLVTPWWTELNVVAALVIIMWGVVPAMYFTNTWQTGYFPINSSKSFDNTASKYDPSAILTGLRFDEDKYNNYSRLYMPATLAIAYGMQFAALTAVFVHTFLWFRRDIARRWRSSLRDERDVHSRLMSVYPEVKQTWYIGVGLISLVFLFVGVEIGATQLPIWATLIACALAAVLAVPVAMLQAITNQTVPLQVFDELVVGYMLPGMPIANMVFKCVAHIGTSQAVSFAGDLKLGHYMKVPPRVMFKVQCVAAAVGTVVSVAVQDWVYNNIPDVCTDEQSNGYTCTSSRTFATASLIWGGVGPQRMFSPGAPYSGLLWFFLIGGVLPIPFYFLARRYPLSFWRYINIPVFFAGVGAMPPATGSNFASWALVGFVFNYFIRKYRTGFWMRYNYIISAGLDAGVAVAMVIVFFSVQLPKGGTIELDWWGNTGWANTMDADGAARLELADGETIPSW
ncbi:OPT oligopeptide transporter protein-domain-containing protein [Schizophyllum commune]